MIVPFLYFIRKEKGKKYPQAEARRKSAASAHHYQSKGGMIRNESKIRAVSCGGRSADRHDDPAAGSGDGAQDPDDSSVGRDRDQRGAHLLYHSHAGAGSAHYRKSGELLAGDDLHPGAVPVSGSRHHREAGQQAPAGGGMDRRKDQRSGSGKHGQALHGLRALCGGHHGPVRVFQPDEPGRTPAPYFRHERRGRMGHSGVRAHYPLQAQGRPWAVCEGVLRAGAGLCAL